LLKRQRGPLYGYLFAVCYCIAATLIVRAPGLPVPADHPIEVFILGVMAAAAFFTWRPAALLWALSIPLSMYFLLPPAGLGIGIDEAQRLAFYSVVSWSFILIIKRVKDLAERIEERALELVREREQGIEQAHDAIIVCDPSRRITRWNLGARELYGWSEEEARGRVIGDLLQTYATGKPLEEINTTVFSEGRWEGELIHRSRNGRGVYVESRHVLVRNAAGKAIGFLEINRDITERKLAQAREAESARERERLLEETRRTAAEVARNRAQLEAVFHGVGDGIVVFDMQGQAILVNEAEALINGYSSPEEMRRSLDYFSEVYELTDVSDHLVPPEDWPVAHALRGESFNDRELRGRRKDTGQTWYFSFSGGPIYDDEDRQILAVIVTRDITERWLASEALRQREQELRESEERLKAANAALRESELSERARAEEIEAVLDAIPAAVFVARDAECGVVTGNHTTYDLLRLPPESNLSPHAANTFRMMRDGVEILRPEFPLCAAAATGEPVRNCEFDVVLDDGSGRSLLGDALPIWRGKQLRGAIGVFLDVTERKRSEDRLRQAQKLESIGILAGGVAHDFNNLLAGIMGNASLLEDEVDERCREKATAIIKASERAAMLTRQLLAYAGKGRFMVERVDFSRLVHEMTMLLQASIPKKARLVEDLAAGLPPVDADPGQMQQIVMNLLLNAAEAIPENQAGEIRIRTGEKRVGPGQVVDEMTAVELSPGEYVCLEVSDTGIGMEPEVKARIFDPFFTTKFTGRGLGLPSLAGVVRSHNGAVQVATTPGAGSTFRVFLPASARAEDSATVNAPTAERPTIGSILVVDDEDILLGFTRIALEQAGYPVLTAEDGQRAIEVFDRHAAEIGAVLLDLMMPVMDGKETAAALKAQRPDLPIVLMSGYSADEAERIFANDTLAGFIQKPFTAQKLVAGLEDALAAGPGRDRSRDQGG
jgi:two-component system, cell cycle sensor histidine kinase and response regulator CckA